MIRVLQSASNIFFSLLLGSVAFAICAIYFPRFTRSLQGYASNLKDSILYFLEHGVGMTDSINVLVAFVIQDEQLLLMGFVIAMRVLLALLMWAFNSLFTMALGSEG